jgi:hypothetical protein
MDCGDGISVEIINQPKEPRAMPKTAIVDQHAADELELFLENDEPLYRQTQECYRNLLRKQKRGTYDRERAVKLFQTVADEAARRYQREFGSGVRGYGPFDKPTRTAVAVSLRDSFEAQVKNGELSHLTEAKS